MKTQLFNFGIKPLSILLLLLSFTLASAQPINYMVLKKVGKTKRYTFIEGQEITYKMKGDIGFFTDRILRVKDSAIEFASYTVPYTDIEKVFIHKKKHILPNKALLVYEANMLAAAGVLELAYLVNTGKGIYNLGTQMIYLSTPVPTFFLANWVYSLFVKTEYTLAPDEYQLYPVILRKE